MAASVVIIGAGISGISAAKFLHETRNYNVIVLEAEDRIGGRIYTTEFHGETVDIGAHYIHGTIGNSVYDLVKNDMKASTENTRYFLQNSKILTESSRKIDKKMKSACIAVEDIIEKMEDEASRLAEEYGDDDSSTVKDKNLGDVADECWKKMNFLEGYDDNLKKAMFDVLKSNLCVLDGCNNLADVGVLQYYSYEELDGPEIPFLQGFSLVIDKMADALPKSMIRINCSVKSINWNQSTAKGKVLVHYLDESNRPTIVEADHVIVTISLGCLKKFHGDLFHPRLPTYKATSIKKLGFGSVGKIYLYYEKAFWKKEDFPVYLLWDEVQEDSWERNIKELMPIHDDSNVLICWIYGDTVNIVNNLPAADIKRRLTLTFRKFFKRDSIPEPDEVLTVDWSNKANFLGSYSYLAVGTSIDDIGNLGKPLLVDDVPRVLFAGEATHDSTFSTTHGALDSGNREAQRIINFYGKT